MTVPPRLMFDFPCTRCAEQNDSVHSWTKLDLSPDSANARLCTLLTSVLKSLFLEQNDVVASTE